MSDESKDHYFRAKSTGLIVDETIKFIKQHKDSPFYVNVWTLLPHAHLNPTPEQLAVYDGLDPTPDAPGFVPWMQKYVGGAKDLPNQMNVFCASLTDLDTQLGRLFNALVEMRLAEDTLIFYASDNGAEDYRIAGVSNAGVGNTGPLRARKRSMYKGGIRTLGLVRWPGHVEVRRRDETSVTGGVDFLPTICKLAGVELPPNLNPDGEDVSDIWLGKARARKGPLFWEWLSKVSGPEQGYMPPPVTVRYGDWKLFVNHDGSKAQLFNIPQDPGEEHDVASENPDLVLALTSKALSWTESLPLPPARDRVSTAGPSKSCANSPRASN